MPSDIKKMLWDMIVEDVKKEEIDKATHESTLSRTAIIHMNNIMDYTLKNGGICSYNTTKIISLATVACFGLIEGIICCDNKKAYQEFRKELKFDKEKDLNNLVKKINRHKRTNNESQKMNLNNLAKKRTVQKKDKLKLAKKIKQFRKPNCPNGYKHGHR